MPVSKAEKPEQCFGGRSFGCSQGGHDQGERVYCDRCKVYLGCARCVERLDDLVCLVCANWAHSSGLAKHGRMVRDRAVASEAWKIIGLAECGQVTGADAARLFRELFA